jgi:hypothetical protein
VRLREMTCPSETYSDAFLFRRSGNPNTRYRAIESKTWRWHFRGVVYIFRKHRLFAQVPDKPLFCEKHSLSGGSRIDSAGVAARLEVCAGDLSGAPAGRAQRSTLPGAESAGLFSDAPPGRKSSASSPSERRKSRSPVPQRGWNAAVTHALEAAPFKSIYTQAVSAG